MKRACMIVHSYYPDDPRVRRETEALLSDGWSIDVICLRGAGDAHVEPCGGAQVYRIPVRRHRGSGLAIYMLEYLAFFILAFARAALLHLRRPYAVVQAHNLPDFLVFSAVIPRLLGARVVLDLHDLTPELYATKFSGDLGHPMVRALAWVERRSTAFATHVLTACEPFRRRLIERGVPAEKVTVILNTADPRMFQPAAPASGARLWQGFTLMYHGGLFERYGLDIAIRAVDRLRGQIPGLRLEIYGDGEAAGDLQQLIDELGLGQHVQLHGFVAMDSIPALIAAADLGVVPYRRSSFTNLLYPTKAFEYLAVGVPVVISHIQAISELFPGVPDMFFEPEDPEALAAHILALYRAPERARRLLAAAGQAYAPYTWERQREVYLALMEQLAATARSSNQRSILIGEKEANS